MLYWRDWNLRLSYFDYSDDKIFFFSYKSLLFISLHFFLAFICLHIAPCLISIHTVCYVVFTPDERRLGFEKKSRPYSQRGKKRQRHKTVFNFNLSSFLPSAFFQHVFVYKSIYEYGCSVMYLQMFIFTFTKKTSMPSPYSKLLCCEWMKIYKSIFLTFHLSVLSFIPSFRFGLFSLLHAVIYFFLEWS